MLNKLSFNLMNSLNESETETYSIKKKVLIESDTNKIIESVDWSYYDKFDSIINKYMPDNGEGETIASQIVTAIDKLIYKWYNDGDVYDNTNDKMRGWSNDLSDCANWLDKYCEPASKILDNIYSCDNDDEYEDILKELADKCLDENYLVTMEEKPKQGSIYKCDGKYKFEDVYNQDFNSDLEECNTENKEELNEEPMKVENKEERLANLKTQLEQDGDQLSDDEKEAIENEIADLEREVYPEANLNEESEEQNEDSDDFTTDMNTILDAIKSIDITSFGTHRAEEVVDTLIDICNRQINGEGPEIIDDSETDLNQDSNIDSDSGKESEVEPIQDSEEKPVTEAATKGLKVTQSQGNIYMLEDENKKIYVGENYNEDEHILENAEIYDSAEDAQKDYLSRCDITKTEN